MNELLIAPCGMNCGVCISYQAGIHELNKKGFHKTCCPGCIPRGKNCLFMDCTLLTQGKVRFCFECEQFPCKRLKALDKRYRTSYHLSMIENLVSIRDDGIEAFLAKETEKWQCPKCGGMICCHNGLCLACDLETLCQNKKYRWNEQ